MFICYSPAKINLFLHIVGSRADGYHLLESVLVKLNLCDEITIENSDRMICESSIIGHNLVIEAAEKLKEFCGISKFVKISIKKNIPIGSGLGGGSSNAASVLKALIKIWDIEISNEDLLRLATSVGADVPFFLHEGPALVSGIGDVVKPIHLGITLHMVLINAGYNVSTSDVFKLVNKCYRKKNNNNLLDVIYDGSNDLEECALQLYPELINLKNALKNQLGVRAVRMTGSGSTFFGIFENDQCALAAVDEIKNNNPQWLIWYEKILI